VADTGIGINHEFLPYVFHRFHQADSSTTRRQGGLGLGLSLVRNLVELHGGTVEAESDGAAQGSTFRVNLPVRALRRQTRDFAEAGEEEVVEHEEHQEVSSTQPSQLGKLHGLWVLVVDDEADARELVATLLSQCGARVTTAASAAEAFLLLRQGEAGLRPDVLVSDIGMPDEDGYQLLRRIRALARDEGGAIPAIALTAFGRARDRIKALSVGFQTHIPKPVEPEELMMVIAGLTGDVRPDVRKEELWTKQKF
jgi:CheY-like chemotaxis protein